MLHFNDDIAKDEKIASLRKQEEEEFLQVMADKHGIPYVDLSVIAIDVSAVGLLKENDAREALVGPFELGRK